MDSLITAAARALAAGDPLGALNRVALRGDAPALALRGIAMAQLGDLARARALVRSAARAFGATEAVARARCVVAQAELALAPRERGACALSRAPPAPPDRASRRGRARARWARSGAFPRGVANRARAGGRGHRDAAAADEAGARGARACRARRPRRRHPGADGG